MRKRCLPLQIAVFAPVLTLVFMLAAAPVAQQNNVSSNVDIHQIENVFVSVADRIMPAVVSITVGYRVSGSPYDELFSEEPFNINKENLPEIYERGKGSGFIIEKNGCIITNAHVIEDAEKITVELNDGRVYDAQILGVDPRTDIALLKIVPENDLPVATLGDSDKVKIGQFAIAVGNPSRLDRTMSVGHITGLGRKLPKFIGKITHQNFIQTDASINLGNSGGPLLNIDGEVIGINTAVIAGAQSIGFAVPINTATSRLAELLQDHKVTYGFLGISIQDVPNIIIGKYGLPDRQGALVSSVVPDSPAERYNLKLFDVIRSVNGATVADANQLQNVIAMLRPGAATKLELYRDRKPITIEVVLDEREPEEIALPILKRQVSTEDMQTWGLTVEPLPKNSVPADKLIRPSGVRIKDIKPGSPASDLELEPHDIILEIERETPKSLDEFNQLREKYSKPGAVLELLVQREQVSGAYTTVINFLHLPSEANASEPATPAKPRQ